MDHSVYATDAEVDETHWWFRGRRRLFEQVIDRTGVAKDAPVVDVGTSAGTNLRMLKERGFRNYRGLDPSEDAVRFCRERGLGTVDLGSVTGLPYADNSLNLVLATDVIEHVDDDARAVRELDRVLAPGGWLLLTVPTFQSLWGLQDELAHHKRRYREHEVRRLLDGTRLDIQEAFYFNFILFLPIFAMRQLMRMRKPKLRSEADINTPFINKILAQLFRFDIWLARRIRPPFGVSLCLLARKS